MIKIRMLGCHGGIGGSQRQTTCYLLGDSVLIDAGTGLGTLPLDKMLRIDHVVLTHAHLDHITCLPLMIDSVCGQRTSPLQVWALPEVIASLSDHIFNDKIWPDFTLIPTPEQPFLKLNPLTSSVKLNDMQFTTLPARHGIPGCGYRVERKGIAIAFSGDTSDCPEFWEKMTNDSMLEAVVVECSYPSSMKAMASLSMHLDASTLIPRLSALPKQVTSVIVHRKPGLESQIAQELLSDLPGKKLLFPEADEELIFGT